MELELGKIKKHQCPPPVHYLPGENNYIDVTCSGNVISLESSSPPSTLQRIKFRIVVSVNYYSGSPSDPSKLQTCSYLTHHDFSVRLDYLRRPEVCRYILEFMNIPFSLENEKLNWRAIYYFGDGTNNELTNKNVLRNSCDLMEELKEFFSFPNGVSEARLKFTKWVEVAKEEVEAWICWRRSHHCEYYNYMHRDPMRELRSWMVAKVKPRDREEEEVSHWSV